MFYTMSKDFSAVCGFSNFTEIFEISRFLDLSDDPLELLNISLHFQAADF